jgi:serine/threonine protein kinase/tetratricopeptide (TPR) repeat protein
VDSTRWSQVQEIFLKAVELSESKRSAFLRSACGDDAGLSREVGSMLAADSRKTSLLDRGLPDLAYEMVGNAKDSISSQEFGPYRLIKVLGEGGMGVVWLAERADAGNRVAIKFLPHATLTPARRERFSNEIRTHARLEHPYIARLYDAGTLADGTPWFVMEYVDGEPIDVYCSNRCLPLAERLRLFLSVCEAVQFAHTRAILHRDLKPSNILVAQDGKPRLLDFGIAKHLELDDQIDQATTPSLRFLSWDYAAPEWARDGVQGLYTDVYSLGVILYQLLTGRLPFDRSKIPHGQFAAYIAANDPERPSVVAAREAAGSPLQPAFKLSSSSWSDLDLLCLKAMHRDPRERYASVESLIRDIDHYLNDEPLEAQPVMLLYRTGKFIRRNRQAVIATSAMLLLTVSLVAFFIWRLASERNIALAQAARVQHIQNFMTDLLQGGDLDAGPAVDLSVQTMIDRGARQADALGSEPEVQADLYETLGVMSHRMGRLDQADSLLGKALNRKQSLTSVQPDSLARTQIALSLLRADEGRAKEGEQQVRRSLDAIRSNRSPNRALLGRAELALGTVMIQAGEQRQAIAVLDQAIQDITPADGARSPQLSQALATEADANMYLGNYDAADTLNRRALEIDRAVYGENHPHVAEDLGNLAQTQETRDNYAQAEPLERQALAIMMRWYGPSHPETARKMTTLASTLVRENKAAEATDLLGQALTIQERTYGPDNPKVAYVLNSIGYVAQQQKRFDEAEQDYIRVSEIYRQAYGDADYRVAVAQGNLAGVYQAEKQYGKAVRVLEVDIQRFARALGPKDIQTGMAQVRLGRNLLLDKRYAEAAVRSLDGYNILVNQMSPDSAWVAGARHDLAIAYAKLGNRQKATQYASIPVVTKP